MCKKVKRLKKAKLGEKKVENHEESQKESECLLLLEFFPNFHLPPLEVVTQ
jgi:hypothetical protein